LIAGPGSISGSRAEPIPCASLDDAVESLAPWCASSEGAAPDAVPDSVEGDEEAVSPAVGDDGDCAVLLVSALALGDEDALSPAVGDCAVLLVSALVLGDEDALSPAVGDEGDCAVLLVSALVPVEGDWAVPPVPCSAAGACAVPLAARECDPLVLHAAASTTAAANPMARTFMVLPPWSSLTWGSRPPRGSPALAAARRAPGHGARERLSPGEAAPQPRCVR
jgi:hypothetical protein